jgi:molybdate transport system substrate-binding protein
MRPARCWPAAAALVLTAATACGAPSLTPAPTGDLTVLADSSLTEAFTAAGRDFETANPGVRVSFTFGGSGQLAGRVADGAAADVFAAAGPTPMREVTNARRADGEPSVFAANDLVIAVPAGNPAGVADLHALARVRVAVCVASEPCGDAARAVLSASGVSLTPVAEEPDVKATLDQVLTGQVDAALVYRTDARAAESKVDTIEFIESVQARQSDQVVPLTAAPNQQAAHAFVAYLTSERARAILAAAGFQAP